MPELDHRLIAALEGAFAALSPRRRWLVGVSGGMDSLLMLETARHCLRAHPGIELQVLHVHHGLSPHADAWAAQVTAHCATRGVSCRVLHVDVDRGRPSREAAAREARHAALAAQVAPGDALLLAHHADDQAETLLLRLLRGSGLAGLGAMRPVRAVGGVADAWLVRPWLGIPRTQLEEAARSLGLSWVEDESNADTTFDRNYLRHDVVPRLQSRWPAFAITAASTARRLAEADALLEEYLERDLQPLRVASLAGQAAPALDASGLVAHTPARQRALLRCWLRSLGAPVMDEAWLVQVLQLAAARVDSEGEVRVGGWEMHRFRGQLHAFAQLPVMDATRSITCALAGEIDLGAGCGRLRVLPAAADVGLPVACIAPGAQVSLAFRQGGEVLRPNAGSGSRPLKKILQERDVPPWLRGRMPLVRHEGRLVAVGDLLADVAFMPTDSSPASLRLQWIAPGQGRG